MIEKNIKVHTCPICNEPLMIKYILPTKKFVIGDGGEFIRDDSHNPRDLPHIEFVCSNNEKHNLKSENMEFLNWMILVETRFMENHEYLN